MTLLPEYCRVALKWSGWISLGSDMRRWTSIFFCQVVESLQSHFILTMFHWSSGLTLCFPSQGTWIQIPWGVLMWNQDSPVSVVSLHWWPRCDWSFLWPRLRRASSRTITRPSYRQCDNPNWSHTAFFPAFTLAADLPSGFTTTESAAGGSPVESLQSRFILTMSHWSSGPTLCFPSQGTWIQIPWGVLLWNRDSPVSVVLLQIILFIGNGLQSSYWSEQLKTFTNPLYFWE